MLDSMPFGFSGKTLEIAATVFLALLMGGAMLIGPHNRLPGRGNAPLPMKSLGKMPILQVELARNKADLVEVLVSGDLKRNLQDARAGNNLDTFLFIPAYSGLLISIGLMLARGDDRWRAILVLVALIAVPLAAVCDWTENSGISKVLDKLAAGKALVDSDATRISTPSFIKWTTLAFVLLFYGVAALRKLSTWNWLHAIIAVSGVGFGAILVITLSRYLLERYGGK